MIHLDTNYLIGSVTTHSPLGRRIGAWFQAGEEFAASAVAWSEFLNGPVTASQVQTAMTIIQGRITPFGAAEARIAANLFNGTGRRRASRYDCFIAATAMNAGVPLATENRKDFAAFVSFGLSLA